MVEFALAAPLFFVILIGIIVLGIVVFYNQQITNAAREAARFASVHSASAQCPVVGSLNPPAVDPITGKSGAYAPPISYVACDSPANGWARMVAHARSKVFGLNSSGVIFTPCWSGYRTGPSSEDPNYPDLYDTPPTEWFAAQNPAIPDRSQFDQCSIGGVDPTQNPSSIPCQAGLARTDTASSMSDDQATRFPANRVTVYACFSWSPPGAGFLLIPETVTFRAVISEPIQRQQ